VRFWRASCWWQKTNRHRIQILPACDLTNLQYLCRKCLNVVTILFLHADDPLFIFSYQAFFFLFWFYTIFSSSYVLVLIISWICQPSESHVNFLILQYPVLLSSNYFCLLSLWNKTFLLTVYQSGSSQCFQTFQSGSTQYFQPFQMSSISVDSTVYITFNYLVRYNLHWSFLYSVLFFSYDCYSTLLQDVKYSVFTVFILIFIIK